MTTVSTNVTEGNKTVKTETAQKAPGTDGALLQAKGLNLRAHRGASLVSDISFHIEPGELIALTGPSRSGKSALLQGIAGYLKPMDGGVYIDGVSLYANRKAFRSTIGYVPAEYGLQQNLTAVETLRDGARLRMPRHASQSERAQRVLSLLETVGLSQVANQRVDLLNKAEKRKLSIAVELAGFPKILLMDESAEPLTSFEELQITRLLRELSRYQGLTIVQVSEQPKSVEQSDKVIFLTPGGTLAWFGPVAESYIYFKGLLPKTTDVFGLEETLEILVDPQLGDGKDWAKRFASHPAYQKYVDDPLNDRYPDLLLQSQPVLRLRSISKEKLPPAIIPRANGLQKFMLLVGRNTRLLWRDKTALFMVLAPPVIGLVDFVLSSTTMSDPKLGDPNRPPIVLGLLVFLGLFTAALLVQNEISKEKAVYQREQRTNPLLFPYVMSKIWLVGILALYQGLVWAIIHFVASNGLGGGISITEGLQRLFAYGVAFSLIALLGGILGLIASALSMSPAMTTRWVLLLTLPQLFLSGSVIPLTHLDTPFRFLASLNPSSYAFETLLTINGYGQAVASDPCWQLPEAQRNTLPDDKKFSCPCMGVNIFSKCNFPGIQAFYSFVIEQPEPDQANYEASIIGMRQYADDLSNWQRGRSIVIGNAEGIIAEAVDHYGQGFNVNLLNDWLILTGMSLWLVVLLIGIQQKMER